MIDSQCHLADKQFKNDLDVVVKRARDAGVEMMVAIADTFSEAEECIRIAEEYENVYCTVGVHPHVSRNWKDGDGEVLRKLIQSSSKAVAVGEMGLDYHYDNSPRDVQQVVFKEQLEIAKELGMPSVVHNRESIEDLKSIIHEVDPPSLVVHCCTEKWEDVSDLVERGFLLSFTGIATYAKSKGIRNTIQYCPLEQLMIETDAPYLAPLPHRGKRNEPAYVVEVAKCIAEVKGISVEEVEEVTTATTVEFYGIAR